MLRLLFSSFAIASSLFLDPCGSGGTGSTGSADGAPASTSPSPSGTTTTPGTSNANIPAAIYEGWSYLQVTMYEPGEDPIVSNLSGGTADFNRDGTYKLSYKIGTVFNGFEGKYTIDDKRLKAYDDKGALRFDFAWAIGSDPKIGPTVLTLTTEDDQGNPELMYALVPRKK